MKYSLLARPLAVAALLTPVGAQTTTLNFEGISSWQNLVHDYGDRVTSATTGGYAYGGGGSFTPNVVATFGGEASNGQIIYMQTWPSGYNGLLDIAYLGSNSGGEMQITLIADPGHAVSISAFDIGNLGAALTLPYVRVTDETGAVLYEDLNAPLNEGTSNLERNYVLSPAPTGRILTVRVGLDGLGGNTDNVGIDNLTFSQRAATPIDIGTRYCTANPNITGGSASIRAWGSDVVAQNDLTVIATGVPMEAFGYFIASQQQGFVANPAGSAGNLCLSGSIGRFVGPGQVLNSGASGRLSLGVDLSQMPTPLGLVQAAQGETWNFQAWYRDVLGGGATSNFTDGLSITFR